MEEEEALCRFCFDTATEDDPLISPCRCKGDQKYVHVSCLHKWQRSVLVSQPTHPAFYQRDVRQEVCNVCKGKFDPPPPERAVLMAGFTGAELAGHLREGSLIVTEPRTSRQMARTLRTMRGAGSLKHWIKGIYLITAVETGSASDGGDCITALNLTRRIEPSGLPPRLLRHAVECAEQVDLPTREAADADSEAADAEGQATDAEAAVDVVDGEAGTAHPAAAAVTVTLEHYLGGPCIPFRPTGLALMRDPNNPEVQATLTVTDHVALGPLPGVVGTGDGGAPEGSAGEWEDGGRWISGDLAVVCALVRRETARRGGTHAAVRAVWGDARWARAQLLGEIARGHWGMCAAAVVRRRRALESEWHATRCPRLLSSRACPGDAPCSLTRVPTCTFSWPV